MVTRGIADIFQVVVLAPGAYTALTAHRSSVGALVLTEKDILELHHTRIGKQQSGIVTRHQ